MVDFVEFHKPWPLHEGAERFLLNTHYLHAEQAALEWFSLGAPCFGLLVFVSSRTEFKIARCLWMRHTFLVSLVMPLTIFSFWALAHLGAFFSTCFCTWQLLCWPTFLALRPVQPCILFLPLVGPIKEKGWKREFQTKTVKTVKRGDAVCKGLPFQSDTAGKSNRSLDLKIEWWNIKLFLLHRFCLKMPVPSSPAILDIHPE